DAWLTIIEGWRRKNDDLFIKSNDGLCSVMTRGFDSMIPIFSLTPDRNHIQRASRSLDSERKLSMEYEGSNADSARIVMYGYIESAHLTILHLMEKIDSQQGRIDSLQAQLDKNIPISTVEQYAQTDQISVDLLVKDMIKLEEEMINENLEHPSHIENVNEVAESPHPIANSLDAMSTMPNFTKPKEIKEVKVEPKEPIDITEAIPQDNQVFGLDDLGDDMNFNGEKMMNDDVADRTDDIFAANIDNSSNEQQLNNDMMDESDRNVGHGTRIADAISDDLIENGRGEEQQAGHTTDTQKDSMDDIVIEKDGKNEKKVDLIADSQKDSSETVEVEKRRRSSRGVTKPLKYTEPLSDSDSDSEPAVKKAKSDSEMKKDKMVSACKRAEQPASAAKNRRVSKLNDKELECPECDYSSRHVGGWLAHLRLKHSTTPDLAGLTLLCDCGDESLSDQHGRKCTIANVTVLRKRDGPIRRLNDLRKPTVKCVLCE
ncbi:hypothetical protein PENTCL1PPCAC_8265, partial [Pristionchus entomophagus]